jgi:hypothetical protein
MRLSSDFTPVGAPDQICSPRARRAHWSSSSRMRRFTNSPTGAPLSVRTLSID